MAIDEVQVANPITIEIDFVDEDGTVIDISTASPKYVVLADPSGNAVENAGSFVTDGTDGKLEYTCSTDVDEAGAWSTQGRATIGGSEWNTDITTFKAIANL